MGLTRTGPGALPVEVTGFVGRQRELSELTRLLRTARLVTVTGPGGVGKTRVALRAAGRVAERYPDGIRLAELSGLADPRLLADTVAAAIGVPEVGASEESATAALNAVIDYLRPRKLLLILDTCEHLISDIAQLASQVLNGAPDVTVLATSRQPLDTPGEQTLAITPLPVPDADAPSAGTGDAVELFAQRAAAVVYGFTLTPANLAEVIRLCRRLDGIPLAIELATRRLRALSLSQLADRVDDRFRLLGGGPRGGLARHQTLQAATSWSYDLCSADEQALWERLSVFAGGFDLAAAERICADATLHSGDILDALIGLVDKSVVVCDEAGAQARYRLLETVREYGVARLAAAGQDPELLRRRHRDWYLGLVQRFDREWFGRDQIGWAERIRAALANVRVALEWCLHTPGEIEAGQEVAAALRYYWTGCGGLSEGRLWLGRVLATEPRPVPARARALSAQTRLLIAQADHPCAARSAAESLELAHDTGDPLLLASARYEAGAAILLRGGDMAAADLLLRDALAALEALGTAPLTAAMAMTTRAFTTLYLGDPPGAQLLCTRARRLCRRHGDRWWLAYTLHASAVVAGNRGDREAAERYTQEALQLHVSLGDTLGIVASFDELAENATAAGHLERAARLLGAGLEMSESMGTDSVARRRYWRGREALMESVRSRYGEPNFGTAFGYGRRMSVEDAIAYACRVEPEPRPPVAVPAPVTLTRREREVADLLGEGLSNAQIAQRLVVSQRTAESHVANVMRKLGATSRSQVAVWARTHPL